MTLYRRVASPRQALRLGQIAALKKSELSKNMIDRVGCWILAALFVGSGTLHFLVPEPYIRIMPPILPWPKTLVWISGVLEIIGGIGLLVPRLRRVAGYGLALLLVAVFPANIHMAISHVPSSGWMGNRLVQWLRLPLQLPLILWALHYTKKTRG
jgi:uncharacterized membrane protein